MGRSLPRKSPGVYADFWTTLVIWKFFLLQIKADPRASGLFNESFLDTWNEPTPLSVTSVQEGHPLQLVVCIVHCASSEHHGLGLAADVFLNFLADGSNMS